MVAVAAGRWTQWLPARTKRCGGVDGGCRDWCVAVMVAAGNGGSWWRLGFEESYG